MPLQAIAINDFNTSLMRETSEKDEFSKRLIDLYQNDTEDHQFNSGKQAIDYFQQAFNNNHKLYIGMFNDKPICAIGCFVDDVDNDNTMRLDELAMHLHNKNRGIEEQFIKLILLDNQSKLVKFYTQNKKIDKILQNLINNKKDA